MPRPIFRILQPWQYSKFLNIIILRLFSFLKDIIGGIKKKLKADDIKHLSIP